LHEIVRPERERKQKHGKRGNRHPNQPVKTAMSLQPASLFQIYSITQQSHGKSQSTSPPSVASKKVNRKATGNTLSRRSDPVGADQNGHTRRREGSRASQ
jgi:hypothetical protein